VLEQGEWIAEESVAVELGIRMLLCLCNEPFVVDRLDSVRDYIPGELVRPMFLCLYK
jgi:hypothetical protein